MFDKHLKVLRHQLLNAADPVVKTWWENYVKQILRFLE